MTDITHAPTPQFREYLESEVARTWRRSRAFRRYRGLAVVAVSMAIGLTAGMAPAQIREGAQRDSLLESGMADMALAGMRLELARAQVADVTAKVNSGMLDHAALNEALSVQRRMEADALRAKLAVDEIKATSQPPRDDLAAPLVNGRDFVTERLQAELFTAQQRLTSAESALAEMDRRVRAGAVEETARLDAELDVVRARSALGLLARKKMLRKEFLERGTPGEELARTLHRDMLRFDAMTAQEAVRVARARADYMEKRRRLGAASDVDQLRAQLELKERERDLMLLARQLRELGNVDPSRPR